MEYRNIFKAGSVNYTLAVKYLRRGKLVSFPTETVYGLGADACNGEAVAAIFAAKKRPKFNPLIVHVPDLETAEQYVSFDMTSRTLAEKFWPGPFTLVLPRKKDCPLSPLVSAGLDTAAIRVPRHAMAQQLLKAFGGPIAAPSANKSGRVSPTTAEHVGREFGPEEVPLILDGGPCKEGLESTIVQVQGQEVLLLRPGTITPREIELVTGLQVRQSVNADNPVAPGQLKSHYAPAARLRLNAAHAEAGEALLAFGRAVPHDDAVIRNLSPDGSLTEAAANLFSLLRELDETGVARIAVMPIPRQGLGLAINDRLERAAAPRPDTEPDTERK